VVTVSAHLSQEHPEALRSVSVASSASLANVGDTSFSSGHSIEKVNDQEFERIHLDSAGTTLMDGLGEASSGHGAAGLIRREAPSQSYRSAAGPASELEQDAAQVKRHGVQANKAESKQVSWEPCEGGSCKCFSRRRVVIRYQRERKSGAFQDQDNLLTSWYYRSRQRPFLNTSVGEFDKGFKHDANNLQMCGGDKAFAKDCLRQPEPCGFATDDSNPYDAMTGEYCCSSEYSYCSYRCKEDEVFKCPSLTTEINFPGGMDPAGPDVFKKCYIVQYPHGRNPESAIDSDTDVGGKGD